MCSRTVPAGRTVHPDGDALRDKGLQAERVPG